VFAVNPVVLTEMLTEPGIVPGAEGVAESHEPPDVVAGTAVMLSPGVPPMVTVCAAGTPLPS
jgi:hypothetical protein